MKAPLSWLREFVDIPNDPAAVAAKMAACGFAVESIEGEVIDFEITANRPDCLCIAGLALEAAVAFAVPGSKAPSTKVLGSRAPSDEVQSTSTLSPGTGINVVIEDAACARYVLAQAEVAIGPSPSWLAERLVACGVRPINNIVDISNYVMLEMGHPTHAFDAARLTGSQIIVRAARPGEQITTLDGQARTLDASMLVIADRDRAVAVAGVMGGRDSEVSYGTTRIAIEAAYFVPASVRMTGRRLGLKTEALTRFERGADVDGPPAAIGRMLELIERIGAGRRMNGVVDVYPRAIAGQAITLRRARIARLLGDVIPDADVDRILSGLGLELSATSDGWSVGVPTCRVDLLREIDLIEEVGRHWGFDNIPASFPALRSMPRPTPAAVTEPRRLRGLLTGAGLQEAFTFTFIERAAALPFVADAAQLAAIANPLSEKFAVLRPSLLPGLVDSLVYSRRRESADVRLFELGAAFTPAGESQRLAWLMTGPWAEHWSAATRSADFFDARGIATMVAGAFRLDLDVEAIESTGGAPGFVHGRVARLLAGGAPVGVVGQVRPDVIDARGLGGGEGVYGGELDLDRLMTLAGPAIARVEPLPRFPSMVRDLSVFVDERLPAARVRGTISAHAPSTLVRVREFDRYQGKGVPPGQISLSLRLTFRSPDRTLTDADVQSAVDTIVAALAKEHGATLRGAAGGHA